MEQIHEPVAADVIARLMTIPEFVRAYEPDGMKPADFITYGVVQAGRHADDRTQKTLSQFVEAGWLPLEAYSVR